MPGPDSITDTEWRTMVLKGLDEFFRLASTGCDYTTENGRDRASALISAWKAAVEELEAAYP